MPDTDAEIDKDEAFLRTLVLLMRWSMTSRRC